MEERLGRQINRGDEIYLATERVEYYQIQLCDGHAEENTEVIKAKLRQAEEHLAQLRGPDWKLWLEYCDLVQCIQRMEGNGNDPRICHELKNHITCAEKEAKGAMQILEDTSEWHRSTEHLECTLSKLREHVFCLIKLHRLAFNTGSV